MATRRLRLGCRDDSHNQTKSKPAIEPALEANASEISSDGLNGAQIDLRSRVGTALSPCGFR